MVVSMIAEKGRVSDSAQNYYGAFRSYFSKFVIMIGLAAIKYHLQLQNRTSPFGELELLFNLIQQHEHANFRCNITKPPLISIQEVNIRQ